MDTTGWLMDLTNDINQGPHPLVDLAHQPTDDPPQAANQRQYEREMANARQQSIFDRIHDENNQGPPQTSPVGDRNVAMHYANTGSQQSTGSTEEHGAVVL